MAAIVHPLLTLLASLTRQELARQVTYLKAENQILRSKLPKRIELTNQERRRLVKHGKSLGARIPVSHRRWCKVAIPSDPPAATDPRVPAVSVWRHFCTARLRSNQHGA